MKDVTIARRYARALFELAQESKSVDEVLQALSNVRHAVESDAALRGLVMNPLVEPELKVGRVRQITSNKLVAKFFELLARRKRLDLLIPAHQELSEMTDAFHGIKRPVVKTAAPLSDEQKREIETAIAKTFGGRVQGRFEVAHELIGGVFVQLGDAVLDASLKGRVEDFRRALTHSAN